MGLKKFIINLAPTPLVKVFASPYVAGDSIQAAVETARLFWKERHICSTIDLLGEEIDVDEEVHYTVGVYERLIDSLGAHLFWSQAGVIVVVVRDIDVPGPDSPLLEHNQVNL